MDPYEVGFGVDCYDARADVVAEKEKKGEGEKPTSRAKNAEHGSTKEEVQKGTTNSRLRHHPSRTGKGRRILQPNPIKPETAGRLVVPGADAVRQYLMGRQ